MHSKPCPDMLSGGSNIVNFCKPSESGEKFSQFEIVRAIYDSGMLANADVSGSAKLVLIALAHHYNPRKKDMFPSQKYLAQQLGISERSAERAVAELKTAGLVTYETKRVNRYQFTAKFFASAKLSGHIRQNVGCNDRQNVGQTNKHEQKNNSFKKDFSGVSNPQPKGMEYPKFVPEAHIRDDRTPENDFETAKKFVCDLWSMKDNHLVRAKLEKVLAVWGDKILPNLDE